ncbi:hypothetical protein [Seleniivibrio woodruffii]|uniref:Uncharacterized protein n=1 Tax=Seleniivibrio woodruffii TaxID=1078050 RepID=A0A4R1KE78_9BACT|nr:hypothetical protein [Seleniivibrio woodruffii]TCK62303.1 hypothetical protein C8D98_0826 [Seleniivibrio woodruffii]TVZ34580.1 hypothetical protein OF66_0167 [Seleniivibrio woodruffii]
MKEADIYVLLSFLVKKNSNKETIRDWQERSGLSKAVLGRSMKFLKTAKLVADDEPVYRNIEEFLVHGFPYVFPIEKGRVTRGFISGIDATTLKGDFVDNEYPIVWAHPEGNVKGFSVPPLHKAIPEMIAQNRLEQKVYEMLALLDVLRVGQRREIEAAKKRLKELLNDE